MGRGRKETGPAVPNHLLVLGGPFHGERRFEPTDTHHRGELVTGHDAPGPRTRPAAGRLRGPSCGPTRRAGGGARQHHRGADKQGPSCPSREGGRSLRRPRARRASSPGAAGTSPGWQRCRFPPHRTRGLQGGRPLFSPRPGERHKAPGQVRGRGGAAEPRAGGTRGSPWQPEGSALPEPPGRGAARS